MIQLHCISYILLKFIIPVSFYFLKCAAWKILNYVSGFYYISTDSAHLDSPWVGSDKALSTTEDAGSQLHSVPNGAAWVGNAPASNLVSYADPTWLLLGAGPGPVFRRTKQLLRTLEKPHRLRAEPCQKVAGLSKGRRLFHGGSMSITGGPTSAIHPLLRAFKICLLPLSLTHILFFRRRSVLFFFLSEISRTANEMNIPFPFVYLNGHILLPSAEPSPSVFCDLITNGINS